MFSLAAIKALQIYGIAIVISMFVAVLIKVLVVVTSRMERSAKVEVTASQKPAEPVATRGQIPDEVVAAISPPYPSQWDPTVFCIYCRQWPFLVHRRA